MARSKDPASISRPINDLISVRSVRLQSRSRKKLFAIVYISIGISNNYINYLLINHKLKTGYRSLCTFCIIYRTWRPSNDIYSSCTSVRLYKRIFHPNSHHIFTYKIRIVIFYAPSSSIYYTLYYLIDIRNVINCICYALSSSLYLSSIT